MFAIMLAAQAAGMVTDWLGTRNQIEMGRMGQRLEEAGIESNLNTSRLESEDASLQAMKQLRQNLGSQIALAAARGNASYAGNAASFITESVSNFNADERMRRMNLLGTEAKYKAGLVLSKLHEFSSESKLWGDFSKRTIDRFPTSPQAWDSWSKAYKG